jgi:hypothetical protein
VVRIGDLNYGEVKAEEMDEESPVPIQHSLCDSGKQHSPSQPVRDQRQPARDPTRRRRARSCSSAPARSCWPHLHDPAHWRPARSCSPAPCTILLADALHPLCVLASPSPFGGTRAPRRPSTSPAAGFSSSPLGRAPWRSSGGTMRQSSSPSQASTRHSSRRLPRRCLDGCFLLCMSWLLLRQDGCSQPCMEWLLLRQDSRSQPRTPWSLLRRDSRSRPRTSSPPVDHSELTFSSSAHPPAEKHASINQSIALPQLA